MTHPRRTAPTRQPQAALVSAGRGRVSRSSGPSSRHFARNALKPIGPPCGEMVRTGPEPPGYTCESNLKAACSTAAAAPAALDIQCEILTKDNRAWQDRCRSVSPASYSLSPWSRAGVRSDSHVNRSTLDEGPGVGSDPGQPVSSPSTPSTVTRSVPSHGSRSTTARTPKARARLAGVSTAATVPAASTRPSCSSTSRSQ